MAAKLDFEIDDIMTTPDAVAGARLVICEHAPADDAATFLNMCGIGAELAWNMGGVVA